MNRGRNDRQHASDLFYIELGSSISRERRKQNRTQEQLAEAIGLTRTSITNVERGRQKLLIHKVFEIASELQVDVSELLPASGRKPTPLEDLPDEQMRILLRAVPEISSKKQS